MPSIHAVVPSRATEATDQHDGGCRHEVSEKAPSRPLKSRGVRIEKHSVRLLACSADGQDFHPRFGGRVRWQTRMLAALGRGPKQWLPGGVSVGRHVPSRWGRIVRAGTDAIGGFLANFRETVCRLRSIGSAAGTRAVDGWSSHVHRGHREHPGTAVVPNLRARAHSAGRRWSGRRRHHAACR